MLQCKFNGNILNYTGSWIQSADFVLDTPWRVPTVFIIHECMVMPWHDPVFYFALSISR